MTSPETKINLFKTKMLSATSFEVAVYEEAIYMVENDVNTDKVQSWVDNVLCLFHNKPKPLSEKEKTAKINKLLKKEEREAKLQSLIKKLNDLFDKYGILVVSFFDWKELDESEYELFEKIATTNGYNIVDLGDGAFELYVSKQRIDLNFMIEFDSIKDELSNMNKGSVYSNKIVTDIDLFRRKINEIIK